MDVDSAKEQLHHLIDRLPPEQDAAILRALTSLSADPALLAMLNAPPYDEPYTAQQRCEDARAEESFARGEGIPHNDLLRELGM